ncbi:hypothetical protein AALP_AA1G268800 [Arabis alpina]|uniref:Pollen Ole e 1 allergen and extensin family protein n=1 Tax=Arabis alpina TaxID=50452 RepID=A0A087HQY0_ARAAL|nr:hypothetical protein AALP_AA1G268800 [Arabis alpina]
MAKANMFLLSIFVIASLCSPSHGLYLNGLRIGTISIRGVLHCTLNANLNAPPVSAQTVFIKCAGSSTNLGQAVTDITGAYTVVIRVVDTLVFDASSCRVVVVLPVATCAVFPPDGVLTASISLVSVLQNSVGNIANFITNQFVHSL